MARPVPFDVPVRSSSYGSMVSHPPSEPPPPVPASATSSASSSFISNAHRHLIASLSAKSSVPVPFRLAGSRHSLPGPIVGSRRSSFSTQAAVAAARASTASPTLRPTRSPGQTGGPRDLTSVRSMGSLRQAGRVVLEPAFRPVAGSNRRRAASTVAEPSPVPAEVGPSSRDRLVVGVDFGTTYSAVAAAHSSAPDEIDIIKTWPGGNGITSDKVPTEIGYFDPPAESAKSASTPTSTPTATVAATPRRNRPDGKIIKWGFQLKPEEPRFRCIKLFLDHNQQLPHFVSHVETMAALAAGQVGVTDVVADYLKLIHGHTMATLTKRYGDAFMAATPVEFVLTVPAVWSDAAKAATVQAAEMAGMGGQTEVRLISEPEAAAVYTLRAIQPNTLQVGDNFIVCDAGGGTVDLIAYTILQLEPLRVEESAVGDGGLCGSAFLNYRFEHQVQAILGEERYQTLRQKKPRSWNTGLRHFEEFVKRNYTDSEDADDVTVPFPGLADDESIGLMDGFLTIGQADIKAIFDPVVADVISLVQTQVERIRAKAGSVAGIILVGGFGQSDYLFRQMKRHFQPDRSADGGTSPAGSRPESDSGFPTPPCLQINGTAATDDRPIEVMHPLFAWTAVVRGAVIRGLEGGMVISRRSRYHYGTSYATVFDDRAHEIEQRYWSPLWERWMVGDVMHWHIGKGQPVSEAEPVSFHYTRNFRPGDSLMVTDDLIVCLDDEPPERCDGLVLVRSGRGSGTGTAGNGAAPSTTSSPAQPAVAKLGVQGRPSGGGNRLIHVCTLTTDLAAVPKQHFTRLTTTAGVEFDNLDFALSMRVDSGGLQFDLTVDGVKYGSVLSEFH